MRERERERLITSCRQHHTSRRRSPALASTPRCDLDCTSSCTVLILASALQSVCPVRHKSERRGCCDSVSRFGLQTAADQPSQSDAFTVRRQIEREREREREAERDQETLTVPRFVYDDFSSHRISLSLPACPIGTTQPRSVIDCLLILPLQVAPPRSTSSSSTLFRRAAAAVRFPAPEEREREREREEEAEEEEEEGQPERKTSTVSPLPQATAQSSFDSVTTELSSLPSRSQRYLFIS